MKDLYLLREYRTFEYELEKPEDTDKANKPMILKGVLQKCNTLNHNGRIYPREVLLKQIEIYKEEKVKTRTAYGELDHSDSFQVSLQTASHFITDIWVEGDVIMGKVQIFDTPTGEIVKAIVRAGARPGISSRAIGSLEEDRVSGAKMVGNDLKLICWDFVSEPSTPGAFMSESRIDPRLLRSYEKESSDDSIKAAIKDILTLRKK
jgi:hypothetical protein